MEDAKWTFHIMGEEKAYIMTRLQVGQFGVQFLAGAREFSQKFPDQLWAHPASCSMGTRVYFSHGNVIGVKSW